MVIDQAIPAGCEWQLFGMCWVTPPEQQVRIFGFAEFVVGLALLVIVYTLTDTRYRFRIQVAPIPLWTLTFIATGGIGMGTLLTGLWFGLQLPLPRLLAHQAVWEAGFGLLFLLTVMTWIWYAFIHPPIFGKRNCQKFASALYMYVLRGSDSELSQIAAEIARSADALIRQASERPPSEGSLLPPPQKIGPAEYAHDIMLLIGDRKLCRSIVGNSPGTAIAFFQAMSLHKKYRLPLSQFASNITTEAIHNKDSVLYHEDAGYYSGLIGYLKPFSTALYGNFDLVETLASDSNKSSLDVDYRARRLWDAAQVEAYGRAILITLEDYLERGRWREHSFTLFRACKNIQAAAGDVYKLNGNESGAYASDIYSRLSAVVDFARDAVVLLNKHGPTLRTTLRRRGEPYPRRHDLYDLIADFMFDIIFEASSVRSPDDLCWTIHHNTVWSAIFGLRDGAADKIVRFKLRRLLYDEIVELGRHPNYKSARILGLCLNVIGLTVGKRDGYGREEYALRRAVLSWTKRNYLKVKSRLPDVAAACVMGSITFDEDKQRLVKTYAKGLSLEARKEYLDLDPPTTTGTEGDHDPAS